MTKMKVNKHLAFVFPGQGSQSVGMLKDLSEEFSEIRHTFDLASQRLGYDVWELVSQGPAERLNETERTQPALLAASVALWRVWRAHHGISPEFLAGHSLGEYSALVCAEAIDFADAIALVALRGRLMQHAVPMDSGAMAAIVGLTAAKVKTLCEMVEQAETAVVAPANFNSLEQTVISGTRDAVLRVVQLAAEEGAKLAKVLPVSVPSHCQLMASAAGELAQTLKNTPVNSPRIPIIHNVNVEILSHPDDIRQALVMQLSQPVRWVETLQFLVEQGITTIYECGPGKVLSGLIARTTPEINVDKLTSREVLIKEMA
jgi:[acyl-carrier-protein] S-malonyltransferase